MKWWPGSVRNVNGVRVKGVSPRGFTFLLSVDLRRDGFPV